MAKKALVKQKQPAPAKSKKQELKETVSTAVVVASLEDKAKPVFNKLKKMGSIICQKDFDLYAEHIKTLKAFKKEGELEKKGITDGIKRSLKAINAHFQPFFNRVWESENDAKEKMEVWLTGQAKKKDKLLGDFKAGKISVSAFSKKEDEFSVSSGGGASIRNLKTLEIVDVTKIPREYMVPDERAIREALLSGTKVPGAKMKTKKTIAI